MIGNEWMFECTIFTFSAILAITVPLIALSIGPHVKDLIRLPIGLQLNYRPTSLLVFYSLVILALPFVGWIVVYLYLSVLVGQVLIYYLYKQRYIPQRVLDYIPIFVWIVKDKDTGKWEFEKASWQFIRQRAVFASKEENADQYLHEGKRITLITDSGWDSLYLGSVQRTLLVRGYLVSTFIAYILLMISMYTGIFAASVESLFMTFIILPFIIVFSGMQVARWPLELVDYSSEDTEFNENMYLSEKKLKVLWSLQDNARLNLRRKLQDPFIDKELYHTTFRDGLARLLIDEIDYMQQGIVRFLVFGYDAHSKVVGEKRELLVTESEYFLPTGALLVFQDIKKLEEGDVYETYDSALLFSYLNSLRDSNVRTDREVELASIKVEDIRFRKIVKEIRKEKERWRKKVEAKSKYKKLTQVEVKTSKEKYKPPEISSHFGKPIIIKPDKDDSTRSTSWGEE
jgi:hypothetical protein